jgi:GrpB-like predicted nucleotidyltransferase (UPF0157 family)
MISEEQQKWLNHLSDTEKICIIPYNPKTKIIFQNIKKDLIKVLGKTRISHRGSTALEISGQGEIDLYIPANKKDFNVYLNKLILFLGKPGSIYPLQRVRFVKFIDDIKVEIFLINKNCSDWKNGIKFENYLKRNPIILKKYEKLKNNCNGFSMKNYYTEKVKFINYVLKKHK